MEWPDYSLELKAIAAGHLCVVGVDEVGRGPLAGPVTAAAVVLEPKHIPKGLNDSKKLTARKRQTLHDRLMDTAEVSVAHATVEEIDELNILRAAHLAMLRALDGLPRTPDFALIDGNMIPRACPVEAEAVIRGDGLSASIAAASIVAKIRRDRIMMDLAQQYPGYGWETNMGYGSKKHMDALANLGVTPHHRRSFKPVHKILYQVETVSP